MSIAAVRKDGALSHDFEALFHHLYVPGAEDVRVLAISHAQRGMRPPLRA